MVYTKSAIEMKDVPKTSKASPTLPDRQKEIEDTTIHFIESDLVTTLVGSEEHPFRVYKDLLCEWIPYFQACLKADWRSDSSEPIKLRHFKIEGFRVLLRWLFNEELPFHTKGAAVNWKLLDIAYETADGLAVFDLQNKLVDFVLKATRPKELYWEPKKSEILKMLQLAHTPYYRLVLKNEAIGVLEDPGTTLAEIMKTTYSCHAQPWPDIWEIDPCEFHIHDDGNRYIKSEM